MFIKNLTKSLLLLGFFLFMGGIVFAESQTHKLRFLVAHKPHNKQHVELIREFAQRVNAKTDSAVSIELVFGSRSVHKNLAMALRGVSSGEYEMSQIPINRFLEVSQDLDVLDMPLMFDSHEHAARVLDGDIGRDLKHTVAMGSNGSLKGLSFTYSGGWRHIYSTSKIKSLAELKGKNMRFRTGRMGKDAMNFLGIKPFVYKGWADSAKKHLNNNGLAEEAETNRIHTYLKKFPKVANKIKTVLETQHSLYLTMITINGAAFKRLSKQQQVIVQREANLLAKQERAISIRQGADGKRKLIESGVEFVKLNAKDQQILQRMGKTIRKKYRSQMRRWYSRIKAAAGASNNLADIN